MAFRPKAIVVVAGLLSVQANSQEQQFEVASVRPSVSGPLKVDSDPIRFTARAQAVDVLIRLAFGLREYQYQGPYWLHTTRYDIVATTSAPQMRAAQLEMLRNLLIERFKLKFHRESKNVPVYALIAGKGGAKLTPLDKSVPAPFELYSNFSIQPAPGDASELRGVGSLRQFCDFLSRIAGRPVLERTGLTGSFDLRLRCAIDGFPGEDTSPSVFDALPAQLGLKLVAQTAPIEVTIIDHAEKPSIP
jgi:uncharacterized protein (TIGR03435 family)